MMTERSWAGALADAQRELIQQREAYAKYGNPPPRTFRLSDEDVERIARAVVRLLREESRR